MSWYALSAVSVILGIVLAILAITTGSALLFLPATLLIAAAVPLNFKGSTGSRRQPGF